MTLEQLIEWYEKHRAYKALALSSQRNYHGWLSTGLQTLPRAKLARTLSASEVDNFYTVLRETRGLPTANMVCKVYARMFHVAQRYGIIVANPFEAMGLESTEKRNVLWTAEEIGKFHETAKALGFPSVSLAVRFCWVFGQRPTDMLDLKWRNFDGSKLLFMQQKTHIWVTLFVPDFLVSELYSLKKARHGQLDDFVITRDTVKRPLTYPTFNRRFEQIKKAAGLRRELLVRDARRTAFTELANAGATDQELLANVHTDRKILDIYTIRNLSQSKNGMDKRFGKQKQPPKDAPDKGEEPA